MQKAFDKIKERLEECTIKSKDSLAFFNECGVKFVSANKAIEIVNQVASEYAHDINVGKNDDMISRSALLECFKKNGVEITFDLPVEEVLGEDVDIDDFAMLVQDAIQAYKKMVIDTIKNQPIVSNEEVCEWVEKSVDSIRLVREPHRLRLFHIEEERQYCPYCGKKIKVIGG